MSVDPYRGTRWSARPLLFVVAVAFATGCAMLSNHPRNQAEFWGFTAPWDARSTQSAERYGSALDAVVSGWIALDSASFRPAFAYPDSLAARNGGNRRYMALVTSYQGTRFHPETVLGLAEDDSALAHAAGAVATLAASAGYRGLVLDLESMTPRDLDALLAVTRAIRDSARAHGISPVGLAIPAADTAGYPAAPLLGSVDFLMVMLYDEHWLTSPPGPIASPVWVRRQLDVRVGEVGASRLVAALPIYGYQWRQHAPTAVISYADARRLAATAGVPLERDPASASLHATRPDDWTVWVSDAVLLDSLVSDARRTGVTRFALWRLGLEDPDIWTRVVH